MSIQGINHLLGLGLEAKDLSFLQISLRGIIVFIAALAMVRLGDKRFLARRSAFDAILGFIMASMLARAVNGSAAFFPTIGGGFVLFGFHRCLAALAFHSHTIGILVKGQDDLLIENGEIQKEGLKQNHITERDLLEDLRLDGQVDDPKKVKVARLERNGEISVVLKPDRNS
jgi:uncharacterized membrane protein YcaP (DUF421 family)